MPRLRALIGIVVLMAFGTISGSYAATGHVDSMRSARAVVARVRIHLGARVSKG